MISDPTPEQFEIYRKTLRIRSAQESERIAIRRERAWELARQAARFLKESYSAERVLVFGSLVHGHWYSCTSDIDLAALGIERQNHYPAIACLQDLSVEYKIDLVRLEACGEGIRKAIIRAGHPL